MKYMMPSPSNQNNSLKEPGNFNFGCLFNVCANDVVPVLSAAIDMNDDLNYLISELLELGNQDVCVSQCHFLSS